MLLLVSGGIACFDRWWSMNWSMPRRSGWFSVAIGLTVAVVSALPGTSARAEPKFPGMFASQNDTANQRRRELDDLYRQDLATQLGQRGVPLKWQEHALAELTDWRDRIDAAYALRAQYAVDVDWRVTSLRDLTDMRLRAAKAAELSSLYGVRVDWRGYSWAALEGLRRSVVGLRAANPVRTHDADALAFPGSAGRPRRPGPTPKDPDAIIEPTFAFDTPLVWSRPFGQRGKSDPDAILIPTFVTVPTPPPGRDDIIDPWNSGNSGKWGNPEIPGGSGDSTRH